MEDGRAEEELPFFASSSPRVSFPPWSNGDAIQSGGDPAAREARAALVCDEGAGERFVFLPFEI